MPVETHRLVEYAIRARDDKLRMNWSTIDRFLGSRDTRSVLALRNAEVKFSIDGFDYLAPDGLIWVLLLGEHLIAQDNIVWLQLPKQQNQLSYIKRAGFHLAAERSLYIDNRYVLEGVSPEPAARGMQFFRVEPASLNSVLREVNVLLSGETFRERLGITLPDELRFLVLPPFVRTVVETVKNIVQHSGPRPGSGSGYFVIGPVGLSKLRLCVGDVGRGFAATLAEKGIRTENDRAAILAALTFGYDGLQGEGLFRVVEFMSRFNGFLRVHSGQANCRMTVPHRLRDSQSARDHIVANLKQYPQPIAFPGVQIMVDFTYKKDQA